MRISSSQFQLESVKRILDQQVRLTDIQQKISTGRRILNPSEDPAGAARILDLKQIIDINEQYQRNADMVKSRLESQDVSLTSFVDVYQRVRELAVQGLNDPIGQENRNAIALEVRQQLEELLSLASRKDGSGEYLFSGYQGDTNPVAAGGSGTYTYAGDQGRRAVAIGPSRSVEDSDNGFDLFFNINNTTENAFSAVYQLATALESNTQSGTNIADIDAIMENINNFRSKTGVGLNSIEVQTEVNEGVVLQSKELLSSIEDLDLAEAITELNLRKTGLEAAQQSYVRIQGLSLFNFL
jgi:flagellar hook-associated protein 3 FlgL